MHLKQSCITNHPATINHFHHYVKVCFFINYYCISKYPIIKVFLCNLLLYLVTLKQGNVYYCRIYIWIIKLHMVEYISSGNVVLLRQCFQSWQQTPYQQLIVMGWVNTAQHPCRPMVHNWRKEHSWIANVTIFSPGTKSINQQVSIACPISGNMSWYQKP